MNQFELENAIRSVAASVSDADEYLEFYLEGRAMYLSSDPKQNRMRIFTPVASYDRLSQEQIKKAMQANFDSAQDARYALDGNILNAVFMHDLASINRDIIHTAMIQVLNLAGSFGSDYSSSQNDHPMQLTTALH